MKPANLNGIFVTINLLVPVVESIFGGEPVHKPHELRFMAKILDYDDFGRKGHCGGAIISKNIILTAAHCVENKSRYFAIVGHSDWSSNYGTRFKISDKWINPHFKRSKSRKSRNDIALIKLEKDLVFDDTIKPVLLSNEKVDFKSMHTGDFF